MVGINLLKFLMIFLLFVVIINFMNYPDSAPAESIKLTNNSPNQSKNHLAKLKFPNNGAQFFFNEPQWDFLWPKS